jgi:hypothetical protein
MTTQAPKLPPGFLPLAKNEAIEMPTPCFGIGCDRHGACASYWAVNGADPEAKRIGTCEVGGERINFVRLSERVSRR